MLMPIYLNISNNSFKSANNAKNQQPPNNSKQPIRTSIFYINDFHGKSINLERTMTASNAYDNFTPSQPTDKLKFSSGDIMLGEIENVNRVAVTGQNAMNIKASAVGNHECDSPNNIEKIIPDMKYRLLACNIDLKSGNPLSKKIEKSYVQEINGHKYGVIGAGPTDLISRLKYSTIFANHDVHNIKATIDDIQDEVNKLNQQGIDKIILLSHLGYGYDRRIAQETQGIDVILGGHSHNLVKDVKEGENLLYSKKGEPVVITQAGRDGKFFGILNLEFNDKGVITKVQNNVTSTRGFKRNAPIRHVFEKILGKPHIVGYVNHAAPPVENDLIDPNPHAQFLVDCMRNTLNTDIALFNAATVRGYFESGALDSRVLDDLSPFKNRMVVAKYTEKEIVDAIKVGAKSLVNKNNKPGIFQTSGLKYNIDKNGEISDLYYIDKSGRESKIDVHNPREDKIYLTALADYYAEGKDGFTSLNKINQAEKVYDFGVEKCVEMYFKNNPSPVNIQDDGRIKIVN